MNRAAKLLAPSDGERLRACYERVLARCLLRFTPASAAQIPFVVSPAGTS